MKVLVFLVPLLGMFAVTFYVGYMSGQRAGGLRRKDRKELQILRNQQYRLSMMAAQHTVLGDNFAPIVSDELASTREELSK